MERLKELFKRGLFQGRHIKIKYAAAMVFMVAACVATLGTMAFTSMASTVQYEVTGLTVHQNRTALDVSWDDADAEGYEIFLQQTGMRPKIYLSEDPFCKIELDVLDQEYRVTVTAINQIGGLSAATSKNVKTHKLRQEVETEKDRYIGLEDKKRAIEAEAHGNITYTSSDPSVVTVSKNGIMRFISDGRAKVTINVAEGDQYKAAEKTVQVIVYPDTLDTPQMKLAKKTDTTATLRWEPVEYAKGYVLRKYDPAKKRYKDYAEFSGETIAVDLPRDQAKYKLKATAAVGEDQIESEPSEAVKVKSTAASAESYGSGHNLMTLDGSNLEIVTHISGSGGASVPQSMSLVGDKYVVTYVDHGGSRGALVSYSNKGEYLGATGISGMGHANGSTYNPNTDLIYTVKTHRQIRSASCSAYDPESGALEKDFTLPKVTSGIAYDDSNNKYYLSKGNEIYVCDDDFNVEKFIWKRARYNHAQDIGAYNGVALVCTWVSGNTSYIDLYRTSDGAYLGSYNVPIGEIESCFVDDKHLIILMNNGTGGIGDAILRTVDPIAIP